MSRRHVVLLVLSSLALMGYSDCPCDKDGYSIEDVFKGRLSLAGTNLYETEIFGQNGSYAAGAISGGAGTNVLETFVHNCANGCAGENWFQTPQRQVLCEGPCFGLVKASGGAPCFGWMKGTTPHVSCVNNGTWNTIQIPGTFGGISLGGFQGKLYAALFDPSSGTWPFGEVTGNTWQQKWVFDPPGAGWDAVFGSMRLSFVVAAETAYFLHDQIFTNQRRAAVEARELASGNPVWNRYLRQGLQPAGQNRFFQSKMELKNVELGFAYNYAEFGANVPGLFFACINAETGELEASGSVQEYVKDFTATPSFGLYWQEGGWGILSPSPNGTTKNTTLREGGDVSTRTLRRGWEGSPWMDGSYDIPRMGYAFVGSLRDSMVQSAEADVEPQQAGATLTVAWVQLGRFLNFPQFADGVGFSTQLAFTNTGTEAANLTVRLRGSNGADLGFNVAGDRITLPGNQHNGTYDLVVPAGGVRVLRTDGTGGLVVGSARVEAPPSITGVLTFGGTFGLASVGASAATFEGFTAPVESDTPAGINTGIAAMNLSDSETTLTAELYSEAGALVAAANPVVLAAFAQQALFVNEFQWQTPVNFAQFRGLLKVGTSGRIAATVLQTRPNQLATMPVRPL
jgi:hypothetical protein